MKFGARSLVVLTCLAIGLVGLQAGQARPMRALQAIGFDLMQGVAPNSDAESKLAVVHIGEDSLLRDGPWPWRRDRLARIVHAIRAQGASALAIDVVFDKPDRFSGQALADEISGRVPPTAEEEFTRLLERLPHADHVLADALDRVPSALATLVQQEARAEGMPAPILSLQGKAVIGPAVPRFGHAVTATPVLRDAALAEGAVNLLPEEDMVLRRAPLVFLVDGSAHPALPVAALLAAGREAALDSTARGGLGLRLDGQRLAADHSGVVWIDFGRRGRIPVMEAAALDTEAARALDGRIVVVGLQAAGLASTWRLADGSLASGPEVIAAIADAVDVGSALHRPRGLPLLEVGLTVLGAAAIVWLWVGTAPPIALLSTISLALAWIGATWIARSEFGIVLDLVGPLVSWAVFAATAVTLRAAELWQVKSELVETLRLRTQSAEAANEAKTRFLREMNHDIRTPLNAVLGLAQLIVRRPDRTSPAQLVQYGDAISKAGEQVLRLTERALQAAEYATEIASPRIEVIEVNDILGEAAQIMTADSMRTAELDLRRMRERCFVAADKTYLLEALLNLLENAFRHADESERIMLSAERLDDGTVAIEVTDEGPGMRPELLAAIGTPFVEGRAERDGARGPGLGLFIVRRFVEMHGGRLRLENCPPGGLRASIILKAHDGPSNAAPVPVAAESARTS